MEISERAHTAHLSIGANLGDKIGNCQHVLAVMSRDPRIRIIHLSDYYLTEPVGYPDQPWFVNAAVKVVTDYDPEDLLNRLKFIESLSGRKEGDIRFGPRVIDLDILLFDHLAVGGSKVVIPHPRMHERAFVLAPLCDIAPNLVHPVLKKTMRRLLADLPVENQACIRMETAEYRVSNFKEETAEI